MHTRSHIHTSAALAFVCALIVCGASSVRAQQPDALVPPQPAPPPMRYIPEATRAQLAGARDAKTRTRLSIDAAEERLLAAEQLTGVRHYDEAAAALGIYQAIITDALAYLRQIGKSDGKTRDLFKLLEQAVFHHTGRIEAMRRDTPSDYAVNVRAALLAARELRTNALNAFYGNTVLREEPATTKAPPPEKKSPDQPREQP
jgi:hypothetical protein